MICYTIRHIPEPPDISDPHTEIPVVHAAEHSTESVSLWIHCLQIHGLHPHRLDLDLHRLDSPCDKSSSIQTILGLSVSNGLQRGVEFPNKLFVQGPDSEL